MDGAAIRAARERAGYTAAALAGRAGVSRQYLDKLESGQRSRVSPRVFAALASALGITDRRALTANPSGADGQGAGR